MIAFYVYFKFKGWKRLIFAETARQIFNFSFIYDVTRASIKKFTFTHNSKQPSYFEIVVQIYEGLGAQKNDTLTAATYVMLLLTFTFYAIRMLELLSSLFIYVPLMFQIRGNLKEYCVHKIDKR